MHSVQAKKHGAQTFEPSSRHIHTDYGFRIQITAGLCQYLLQFFYAEQGIIVLGMPASGAVFSFFFTAFFWFFHLILL